MAKELFEELQNKKHKVAALIKKAEEWNWISAEEKTSFLSKLENDVLTIGVIGQMKSGKSTFLNAFVFEDDVLPVATTPMTAALSVITYGPKKKIIAEFYSQNEWQEQMTTANMEINDETDEVLKYKIQAAQELVEKSSKLGSSINSLLGKKRSDSFDKLVEYVGADGKYVSITKAVTIYYPKEYLKGVNIVDTPGFNDPIVSREERTKEFLKKADVVLLLIYAEQPFSAADRTILFKHVGECGIGKVLIGINKYDLTIQKYSIEEIPKYVREQIDEECEKMKDVQLKDILRDTEPIPLSAAMALLSVLKMSKITEDEDHSKNWDIACNAFSITTQQEMYDKSNIEPLIDAVRHIIEREKDTILFKKPINAILARGNRITKSVNDDIATIKAEIAMLEMPNDELEDIEHNLSRVEKRIKKKVEGLGSDLNDEFDNINRTGQRQLEDVVEETCSKMDRLVDEWKRFSSVKKLSNSLKRETDRLYSRTLKRLCDDINQDARKRIKITIEDFFSNAEDILSKLPRELDFDQREFVKQVSKDVHFDIDNNHFNLMPEKFWKIFFEDFINDVLVLWPGIIKNPITHSHNVEKTKTLISKMNNEFDAKVYLEAITKEKDKIIENVKNQFFDELLTPFQQKLEEIRQQGIDKQKQLECARNKYEELQAKKKEIERQVETIQSMQL